MKLTLFQIEQEYIQLAEALTDNGGELTPELSQALEINQANLETKSTNYGLVIKQMEYEIDILDSELKRLQGLKKSRENAIDRLKHNISEAMKLYGYEKIETPVLKLSFRKSETVEIDNELQIPDDYKVTKVSVTADKKLIKEAIKEGLEIPGAHLEVHQNLQIK